MKKTLKTASSASATRIHGTPPWAHPRRGAPPADLRKAREQLAVLRSDLAMAQRAGQSLRDSESRYRLLFELNPCPMYIFDENTLDFLDVNAAALQLYGYSRQAFLGMTVKDIRPPEDVPAILTALRAQRRILRGVTAQRPRSPGHPARRNPGVPAGSGNALLAAGEWRHVTRDGTVFDAAITVSSTHYAGREARLVLVTDITARKEAEANFRAVSREWQSTFDSVADAIWVLDDEQRILRCNRAAVALFKKPMQAMVGRHCWEIAHGTCKPIAGCPVARMKRSRKRETMELAIGGHWHQVVVDPLMDIHDELRGAVHVVSDITVHKRAENVLRNMATELERRVQERTSALRLASGKLQQEIVQRRELEREVLEVSEREQHRLGQDLHDGLGQSIIGIGYLISAVQQSLARKAAPEAAELERVTQMIGRTVQQVREMARGLFPEELRNGRITDALKELARHTQNVFGITCRCSALPAPTRVDDSVARQVYRIAQEAVHNAARHSRARLIGIRLSRRGARMALTVQDTGIGISKTPGKAAGMGQRVMKYRADMIGATLRIESERGKGTTVTCVFPSRSARPLR